MTTPESERPDLEGRIAVLVDRAELEKLNAAAARAGGRILSAEERLEEALCDALLGSRVFRLRLGDGADITRLK